MDFDGIRVETLKLFVVEAQVGGGVFMGFEEGTIWVRLAIHMELSL